MIFCWKLELDLEDEDWIFPKKAWLLYTKYFSPSPRNWPPFALPEEKKELRESLEPIDFEEPESDEVLFSSFFLLKMKPN